MFLEDKNSPISVNKKPFGTVSDHCPIVTEKWKPLIINAYNTNNTMISLQIIVFIQMEIIKKR